MKLAAQSELRSTAPMNLKLSEILQATGGTLVAGLPDDTVFTAVTTDSRRVASGDLFVALRGANHDGHHFVAQALSNGALCAIVDRLPESPVRGGLVRVGDTLRALGDLAAWSRGRSAMKVVGITGSNGKTTTKEMVASICEAASWRPPLNRILKNEGNLNNLIGLPLTLLRLAGDEAVGVLEMGMNQPGEIARLTEIARPNFGVVLNVGRAHLQGVGDLAGVAAAKGEMFTHLSGDATIAVNTDDPWVMKIAAPFTGRKIFFGTGGDVRAENVVDFGVDGVAFDLVVDGARKKVRLRLVGQHNVSNALAAAALAHAMGISLDVIATGLHNAAAPAMRMQVERLGNGVILIDDSYNANPSSVEVALEALRHIPGRRVVVLGAMWELGDESRRAHREVGEHVGALGVHLLVTLGDLAEAIAAGALDAGVPETAVRQCATHEEAADAVLRNWQPGDVVLVKGSRASKMEEVVRLLRGTAGSP